MTEAEQAGPPAVTSLPLTWKWAVAWIVKVPEVAYECVSPIGLEALESEELSPQFMSALVYTAPPLTLVVNPVIFTVVSSSGFTESEVQAYVGVGGGGGVGQLTLASNCSQTVAEAARLPMSTPPWVTPSGRSFNRLLLASSSWVEPLT